MKRKLLCPGSALVGIAMLLFTASTAIARGGGYGDDFGRGGGNVSGGRRAFGIPAWCGNRRARVASYASVERLGIRANLGSRPRVRSRPPAFDLNGFAFAYSPGWYDWYGWPDYGYYNDWPSYYGSDDVGSHGATVNHTAPAETSIVQDVLYRRAGNSRR